jgi:PAS domain-containing protein
MKTLRQRISGYLHTILIVLGGLSLPLYLVEQCSHGKELKKFSLSLHAADAGRWYWNLETNQLFWDDQMFVLFGRIKEHWTPNYGGFEAALHPEDRDRVNSRVLKAIEERGGYQDIFRIITGSGEVKEIRASAMVSPDGKYMTGINLPAIHRNGNFKTGLRTRSIASPVAETGPSPVMPEVDFSTDWDAVAGGAEVDG